MAENSLIEWTDATWNVVTGCSVVSPGCTNCYAMRLAGTRLRHHPSRVGLTTMAKSGPVWNGEVRFNEDWLMQPLLWKRPLHIFVAAHGDLFHPGVSDDVLDKVFAVMALAHWHEFQVLTKRPARMRAYVTGLGHAGLSNELRLAWRRNAISDAAYRITGKALPERFLWPLRNVWLGTSVEDQMRADERMPELVATPAAIRFVSAEPILSEIDLSKWLHIQRVKLSTGWHWTETIDGQSPIHQVIAGGESGPRKRPVDDDHLRSLRDQCAAAGVSFFAKQLDKVRPLPPDLQQREFPAGAR
jgi:protein gp37